MKNMLGVDHRKSLNLRKFNYYSVNKNLQEANSSEKGGAYIE